MELDVEKVMILLQRKHSAVREMYRLTKELQEMIDRNDEISADMLLELRGDEMEKADRCMEEIWQMGETDIEVHEKLNTLITSDPVKTVGRSKEEKKIYEIRRKTQTVIEDLRRLDQRLNQRVAGEKSYYATIQKVR